MLTMKKKSPLLRFLNGFGVWVWELKKSLNGTQNDTSWSGSFFP